MTDADTISSPTLTEGQRGNVIGLLFMPADYTAPIGGWSRIWRRHLVAGARPRDRDYMTRLFLERFPQGTLHNVNRSQLPQHDMELAGLLVLLYADSIGMDCGWLEWNIRKRWPDKGLLALTGRRRLFRLDRRTLRALAFRRFLERLRVTEFALIAFMAVTTPALLLWDLVRGRR